MAITAILAILAIPLQPRLLGLIILADNDSDFHGGLGVEVHELKPRGSRIGVAYLGIDAHLNFFFLLVNYENVDLAVAGIELLRLHHEAAASQLAQRADLFAFPVKHQHLLAESNINPLEFAALGRAGIVDVLTHGTRS